MKTEQQQVDMLNLNYSKDQIVLTLPSTAEGIAAARELIDNLNSAQIEFDCTQLDDGSYEFEFDSIQQKDVLDIAATLGIDVEQTPESDDQENQPLYRIESSNLISQVLNGSSAQDLVNELILGVQTPPPPDKDKRKTDSDRKDAKNLKLGGGIHPQSARSTSYPGEPGSSPSSSVWFDT